MLTYCINDALSRGIFPDSLKFGSITPAHKKNEATDKECYRPVSVLPLFLKIFEKSRKQGIREIREIVNKEQKSVLVIVIDMIKSEIFRKVQF